MTLTKEWLLKTIAELEEERDATPGAVNEDAAMSLAAMKLALASLEAEPAIHRWRRVTVEPYGPYPWHYGNFIGFSKPVEGIDDEYYYSAPPAPVVPDEAISLAVDGIMSTYAENHDECRKRIRNHIEDACRAVMLQGDEPVSNRDELPLGYLQGHKDGLEWAAQLAEANHPQTGDWLYDDPIALAAAIRKGPDMPELKSASADEDDNFYSWFGRFWLENYQQNNYTTSAKQMLGTMAEFAFRAGRESATQVGNSPVIQDGWVACSERMPKKGQEVLCTDQFENYETALYDTGYIPGPPFFATTAGEFHPTHWMPLPAAPQQEVGNG